MNILVTGGCGYTGTILIQALLSQGHKVKVVDNQWFGNHLKKHPNLKLYKHAVVYCASGM